MKFAIIFLCLMTVSMAVTVSPNYLGIRDSGIESHDTLNIDLQIDCENKDLITTVRAYSTSELIEGADVVLFYTDYGYQPLPTNGKTGADGVYTMSVPGTLDFLTGLFIVKIDKEGFQTREIEFTYEKCFDEQPSDAFIFPPDEPAPEPEEVPEETEEPVVEDLPEVEDEVIVGAEEEVPEPELIAEPPEPVMEDEVVETEEEAPALCPLSLILLSIGFLKARL